MFTNEPSYISLPSNSFTYNLTTFLARSGSRTMLPPLNVTGTEGHRRHPLFGPCKGLTCRESGNFWGFGAHVSRSNLTGHSIWKQSQLDSFEILVIEAHQSKACCSMMVVFFFCSTRESVHTQRWRSHPSKPRRLYRVSPSTPHS